MQRLSPTGCLFGGRFYLNGQPEGDPAVSMCNDWNNEMSIIDNNNNVLAYIHIQDLAGEYPNFWVNSNGSITMIQ